MKRKTIIGGVVVVLIAGAAVVALIKSHGETETAGDDAAIPTVVSVQTGALKLATLRGYVSGYGMVEPAPATAELPAASAQISASSAGVVAKVNVVEGQHVERGDVLMELNSGAMTVDFAEQELERQKKLFAEQNTSQRNLQNAEAQLASLRVTAPLSGTVARVNVKPGQAVDLTTVVAEVMDLNRLAVSAEIPAATEGLETGEEVQVLTDPQVTTTLAFVSPAVNKDNDTILVRALLPSGGALKPGQFISLRIVTATHTNCLAAPAESVVTDDSGQSSVALVTGDDAKQVPVKIGLREKDLVEITAPELKAGDSVVTAGAYGLPDKTKIRVQNSSDDETSSTNSPSAK